MKLPEILSRFAVILVILACILSLPGCAGREPAEITVVKQDNSSEQAEDAVSPQGKVYFTFFDTASYVYSYANDSAEQFENCSADVAAILKKYHELFDIYHEYSGINNLCTINKAAGGEPVKVSKELVDFLIYAKELYERTDGEMNVMLGSVLRLWHECRENSENGKETAIPTEKELAEASLHTDISLLEIDEKKLTVRISDSKASIDVGALGKGYATEKAAQMLENKGKAGYALNIGGNIRTIGTRPDGSGWVTGIKDPKDNSAPFPVKLCLKNVSCVTSGDYERFFTVDGIRYCHIIDKDTMYPPDYFSSVTVITKDSAVADCLSTALFCMPQEDGLKLISEFPGTEAIWITQSGEILYSPGIDTWLEK